MKNDTKKLLEMDEWTDFISGIYLSFTVSMVYNDKYEGF